MIESFIITFRETLEAALVVGIIFGWIKKTGQNHLIRPAWAGDSRAGEELSAFRIPRGVPKGNCWPRRGFGKEARGQGAVAWRNCQIVIGQGAAAVDRSEVHCGGLTYGVLST